MLKKIHFASPNEYADWYEKHKNDAYDMFDCKYKANRGMLELRNGTDLYNGEIQKFVDIIWENIPALQRKWNLDVAGVFPSVPAYLAGEPENMYVLEKETSEHTPVRIWVGAASSLGIGHGELIRRGAAITAFAQALSQLRPVSITPFYIGGDNDRYTGANIYTSLISWDLMTSPMILSDVAPNLISPNVLRYLGWHARYVLNQEFTGQNRPGAPYDDNDVIKAELGVQEGDVYVEQIYLEDPLMRDPVEWVKNQLNKYTADMD